MADISQAGYFNGIYQEIAPGQHVAALNRRLDPPVLSALFNQTPGDLVGHF